MAQFQVPQFIEVEDKIFGPLTFKQFIYVLGGAASVFILWTLLPHWLAIILALPVGAFFAALAFLKVNGQPFMKVVTNSVNYFFGSRIYTWQKGETKKVEAAAKLPSEAAGALPKLTESKLKELSWSLDIHRKLER